MYWHGADMMQVTWPCVQMRSEVPGWPLIGPDWSRDMMQVTCVQMRDVRLPGGPQWPSNQSAVALSRIIWIWELTATACLRHLSPSLLSSSELWSRSSHHPPALITFHRSRVRFFFVALWRNYIPRQTPGPGPATHPRYTETGSVEIQKSSERQQRPII